MIAGDLCPSCGEFVDDLRASTGWCGSCTARGQWKARHGEKIPLPPLWKRCKYCGCNYHVDHTTAVPKLWGTCPKCIAIVRSRARKGLPRLQAGGRCFRCAREFDFPGSGQVRYYCPDCQPWFRKQRASKAGKSSGGVKKPRRTDGSFGEHGRAYREHGHDGTFQRPGQFEEPRGVA